MHIYTQQALSGLGLWIDSTANIFQVVTDYSIYPKWHVMQNSEIIHYVLLTIRLGRGKEKGI